MVILSKDKDRIISGVTDFYIKRVERFYIYATQGDTSYLIARYDSYYDACREMEKLFNALKSGEEYYNVD
jgi:hypothetical protein